jgi:anti-sigma factor RsiW
MMNCAQVRDLLPDYSVEILDARTHQAVESHLAICADCRAELHTMDAVMDLVAQHGTRQPPPGLFNAVRNRIESGDVVRDRAPWWAWLLTTPARATAMTMAVGVLALGFLLPVKPGVPTMPLPVHPGDGTTSTALAASIRQHAISAGEGPLADRIAWEAMAQLVSQEDQTRLDKRKAVGME